MSKLKRLLVRKANDLIEARNYLTAAEKKAFAIAVAFVNKIANEVYGIAEIDFEVLKKVLEEENLKIDKHFKNRLRKVLKNLVSKRELTLIELPLEKYKKWLKANEKEDWIEKLNLTGYNEGFIFCGVIDDILISDDKRKIIVRFNRFITPMVLELRKKFTVYELKYILLLTTQYGPSLYELLKKNEYLGEFTIKVEALKKYLGATTSGYKYWTQFYKRVLKPAVEDINKHTDLSVSFKPLKGSHGKITEVKFIIKPKKYLTSFRQFSKILSELVKSFQEAGEKITVEEFATVLLSLERVNPSVVLWFLLHYPEGEPRLYAWKHIQLTENSPDIKHPDKFLESLIKDKDPELNWLLDQRTKDLIRSELKKIAGEKWKKMKELENLKRELNEMYPYIRLFEGELINRLNGKHPIAYVNKLLDEEDVEGLKEFISLLKELSAERERQRKSFDDLLL